MMLRHLDPRFALVAGVAADPDEDPSFRAACRHAAEEIAAQCGYSLGEALAVVGLELPPLVEPEALNDAEVDTAQPPSDGGNVGVVETTPIAGQGGAETPPSVEPLDELGGQIAAALKAAPARSDRDVARECGASPTTVGKIRASLGLQSVARTVQRNGKPYEMAVCERS